MEQQIKTSPNFASTDKEAAFQKDNSPHHPKHDKETHGTSNDIDGNMPVDEVKGPSMAQRVKEEFEALVGAVIPKMDNYRPCTTSRN